MSLEPSWHRAKRTRCTLCGGHGSYRCVIAASMFVLSPVQVHAYGAAEFVGEDGVVNPPTEESDATLFL